MRVDRLGTGLLVAGLVLVAVPFLAPAENVRWHDTGPTVEDNGTLFETTGYEVRDYGTLSERGRELYVATLEGNGTHHVPIGEGAPEFTYPPESELGEGNLTEQLTAGAVVIDRNGTTGLPPADEEPGEQRYDLVQTATREPPLTSPPRLARVAALVLGLVVFGYGGNRVLPE